MVKNKRLFIIFILIFSLTGCGKASSTIGEKSEYKISEKQITLIVKENTLTRSGLTLNIKNNTEKNYMYGLPYFLEKENDGIWYNLEPISETAFILPLYSLLINETKELSFDWEYSYGKLSNGKYRIIKEIFNEDESIHASEEIYIAAEFVIK